MGKLGGSRTGFWEELPEKQACTRCFPTPWRLQSISVVRDRGWTSSEEDRQPWKPLIFAKIVRWQRTQCSKNLVPRYSGERLRPAPWHTAAFQLSRTKLSWSLPWDKPVGSFVSVFPTKGSWSWELVCFLQFSVHIAKPIFPRLQRWTAWCDRTYRFGGCGMF